KMDLDGAEENLVRFKETYPDIEIFPTTTIINEGLQPVLYRVADLLEVTEEFPLYTETKEVESKGVLYKFTPEEAAFKVFNEGNGRWRIEGDRITQLFNATDLKNDESLLRFANSLKKLGVDDKLREAGCLDGDMVYINNYGFEFVE
ncbi:MAG: Obg family GTPase CgtA, partial [Erysipelotrichaceae bacterium]|nr:Obg family GTPase CgtA [Erysipelotrichaceae bacterium]